MPIYVATLTFRDVQNGETTKQHSGDFADFAAASAAFTNLLNAYQNASSAQVVKYTLAEEDYPAGAPLAGSSVFERVNATVQLDTANKRANYSLPSPVDALFPAGSNVLNSAATEWSTLMAQFGTGLWEVSDGEHIASTVRGARVYTSSGKTNLPV